MPRGWPAIDGRGTHCLPALPCLLCPACVLQVNLPVMNRWITERITQLLGFEDEIVIGLVINYLEANKVQTRSTSLPPSLPRLWPFLPC